MKTLKFILLTAIVSLLFISYGCQQESVLNDSENLPYLSLPENTDFNNPSDDVKEILCLAYPRMGIHENKDGLFELKVRSGHQANVSENVFEFFVEMIDRLNQDIKSGVTLSRSDFLNESEGPNGMRTDCVARAIQGATGINGAEIDSWIESNYGNQGVRPSDFYQVVSHFGKGHEMSNSQLYNSGQLHRNTIIVYDNHAVNILSVSDSTITFWDYQNNFIGVVDLSMVTHAYKFN